MLFQNGAGKTSAVASYIKQAREESGEKSGGSEEVGKKRPAGEEEEEEDKEPADDVRLHEDGWRDRFTTLVCYSDFNITNI